MKIYPYKQGSASAKALAQALGCKVLFREGKPIKRDPVVINWGSSRIDRVINSVVLNRPHAVANAANKLTTLKLFKEAGVACPEWTESYQEAFKWLDTGISVVARHVLNGHSGNGIEISHSTDLELPERFNDAPLYTQYIKKDQEYRIHVAGGEVIFQQRKARKKEVPDEQVNWQVRNLAGGFIFANADVVAPDNVQAVAIAAVEALGLDFGAADVITNKKGQAFCLEVNTACGLAGKTIDAYVNFFQQFQ
jgi:glutathione synthase/RimK-type ligase-like ATP-grasp enzyme